MRYFATFMIVVGILMALCPLAFLIWKYGILTRLEPYSDTYYVVANWTGVVMYFAVSGLFIGAGLWMRSKLKEG